MGKEKGKKKKRERERGTSGKVGGKGEINSWVYGALKVPGISLTTWQTATVGGPSQREGPGGGGKEWRRR